MLGSSRLAPFCNQRLAGCNSSRAQIGDPQHMLLDRHLQLKNCHAPLWFFLVQCPGAKLSDSIFQTAGGHV